MTINKRIASLMLALLSSLMVTPHAESKEASTPSNANLYKQALALYEHGDFVKAMRVLKDATTVDEYLLRARVELIIRDGFPALSYQKAGELSPAPRSSVCQSLAFLAGSKSSDALKLMTATYAKFPANPEVSSTYGRCLCTVQQSEKGVDLMRKSCQEAPQSVICSDNIEAAAHLNFAAQDSIKELTRQITVKPHSVPLLLIRAHILSESGKLQDALKDYATVLKENPDCQWACYQRATVYRNMQQFSKALDDLARSEKCKEKTTAISARALRLKIECEEHLHQVGAAAADSSTLAGRLKTAPLTRSVRADLFHQVVLLEKQKKYVEALTALQPLIDKIPDKSEVLTVHARILNELKRFSEALLIADKLIARDKEVWEWHELKADALAGLGDKANAAKERAVVQTLKSEYADLPTQYKERIR